MPPHPVRTEEAPGRRKLIAVVYADMVGYSRLIELDDAGTIKRLRALRSGLIDPAIDEHGGRLVQTGGDSLLIAFDSVDGAVRCAIKVQQQLPKFDSDQPPDRAIRFRIGINFGDVIADGTDLHGDMVNVAARLQAECPVGAICITRAVRDHVQQRLDLALEELGPLKLKNIARPVEAFVLRVDETAAAQKPRDQLPPQDLGDTSQPAGQSTAGLVDAPGGAASGTYRHSRPSIAVLPFLEYDPRAEQSYFGDGMIEDVVAALAALPDLFVISRASTLKYRGYAPSIKAIAGELGVRYILSGSFRRREGRLRIAAELADAETQAVIEPYKVEGDTVDLFRLQDILVEQVVQRISPAIRGAELRRIRRKRPENFDAYDYLLRGLDLLCRLDRDEFNQARQDVSAGDPTR